MPRTILVHLNVSVPRDDKRSTAAVVAAIEDALKSRSEHPPMKALEIEVVLAEQTSEWETVYTVHPFDDEWTWDPEKSGAHPWATASLQEAIDHANLVRLEYASAEGVDQDWIAGFWSSIYSDSGDPEQKSARADLMIGYVDPQGNYHEGEDPPIDEGGHWEGEE